MGLEDDVQAVLQRKQKDEQVQIRAAQERAAALPEALAAFRTDLQDAARLLLQHGIRPSPESKKRSPSGVKQTTPQGWQLGAGCAHDPGGLAVGRMWLTPAGELVAGTEVRPYRILTGGPVYGFRPVNLAAHWCAHCRYCVGDKPAGFFECYHNYDLYCTDLRDAVRRMVIESVQRGA